MSWRYSVPNTAVRFCNAIYRLSNICYVQYLFWCLYIVTSNWCLAQQSAIYAVHFVRCPRCSTQFLHFLFLYVFLAVKMRHNLCLKNSMLLMIWSCHKTCSRHYKDCEHVVTVMHLGSCHHRPLSSAICSSSSGLALSYHTVCIMPIA